ncbi:MAG TPA: hypothetical protein VFP57_05195 [Sphingomicrobium sp.]|nr:hypothetical protein [Sphingomicrobium sp.]
MRTWICALAIAIAAPATAAPAPPKPLFASDQPIRITIQGPMSSLVGRRSETQRPGTLTIAGANQSYAINLSPRGITRRASDICQFPPLRVEFVQPPPAGSLFEGQRRLKLVTHCRNAAGFQQKILLEYAAYRLYNLMTPQSFRARLANIDYVDERGRPYVSRVGFFLEDIDDVAARNGMVKARTADMIPASLLDPQGAARMAVFNYMIANLDWSMRAGPEGEGCCHNGRLLALPRAPGGPYVPVPYDFDFSGLVDAPYATPPEAIHVTSVRQRNYRGYCAHDALARAVAANLVQRQAELLGVFSAVPGLDARTQARSVNYLGEFFSDAASGRMFRACV